MRLPIQRLTTSKKKQKVGEFWHNSIYSLTAYSWRNASPRVATYHLPCRVVIGAFTIYHFYFHDDNVDILVVYAVSSVVESRMCYEIQAWLTDWDSRVWPSPCKLSWELLCVLCLFFIVFLCYVSMFYVFLLYKYSRKI